MTQMLIFSHLTNKKHYEKNYKLKNNTQISKKEIVASGFIKRKSNNTGLILIIVNFSNFSQVLHCYY